MTGAEDKIGYRFKDRALLQQALTHPSYGGDHRVPHYQRLEFLGDAVLELYISEMLYKAYPDMPEGKLTRMRADLVKEETLSQAVRDMGVPAHILLSAGEDKSGGRDKSSILCDIFEAITGAIYLDGGRREAGEFIKRALGERLDRDTSRDDHLDSKSRLQALLQAVGDMPEYTLIASRGPAHLPEFEYAVFSALSRQELGRGKGQSKQAAQLEAASRALELIQARSNPDK